MERRAVRPATGALSREGREHTLSRRIVRALTGRGSGRQPHSWRPIVYGPGRRACCPLRPIGRRLLRRRGLPFPDGGLPLAGAADAVALGGGLGGGLGGRRGRVGGEGLLDADGEGLGLAAGAADPEHGGAARDGRIPRVLPADLLVHGLDDGVGPDVAGGLAEGLQALGLGAGLGVALDGLEAVVLAIRLLPGGDDGHVAAEVTRGGALLFEGGATARREGRDEGCREEEAIHAGPLYSERAGEANVTIPRR